MSRVCVFHGEALIEVLSSHVIRLVGLRFFKPAGHRQAPQDLDPEYAMGARSQTKTCLLLVHIECPPKQHVKYEQDQQQLQNIQKPAKKCASRAGIWRWPSDVVMTTLLCLYNTQRPSVMKMRGTN